MGILGRQDTWREGEGRRKRTFLGPRQKRAKKRQKNVQSRRLAVKNKVEEDREHNRFRGGVACVLRAKKDSERD